MGKKSNSKSTSEDSFKLNVLKIFANEPYNSFNYKQIASKMKLGDKKSKENIVSAIYELVDSKAILQERRGKYKLNPIYLTQNISGSKYITGRVDMKQTGKAYIIQEKDAEDIYIAPNNTNHALNGDLVKVMLFPLRKGRKPEGQIVEIIERANKQFVGIVQVSKKFAFLVPDNVNITVDLFIPLESLNGARNGDKAIARITDWPERSKNPFGEIVQVLGHKISAKLFPNLN